MKLKTNLPLGLSALWLCLASTAQAQLSIHYDFSTSSVVTDNNGQLSIVQTLGGLSGLSNITDVNARLNLTTGTPGNPMFLGDLYSSLTFGNTSETQRTAVLLNRAGRDDTSAFGSSLSSLNVTLDESAATNVWATTSSTGTYQADGRLSVNPNAAGVAFAAGSNGLTALNGTPLASNRVSLLVADYSTGGVATLSGWGLTTTGVAAASGTFTPGANATLSDTSSGDTNTIGAILDTTGATGGSMQLNFAGTTTFSNGVTGSAGITKTGAGTVILGGTSGYTGATTVNAGTLEIASGGSTHASSAVTVNNSGSALVVNGTVNGSLMMNASTTLSGTGTIAGNATVQGTHNAGNATAGVQTFGSDLTYSGGTSVVNWELIDNLTSGRGTNFDGINVSGLLDFADATTINLAFNGTGSDVDWNDSLWSSDQTWLLYQVDPADITGFGNVILDPDAWLDSNSATLSSVHSLGSFSMSQGAGGIYINYTVVPETSTTLLGALGALAMLRRRRR